MGTPTEVKVMNVLLDVGDKEFTFGDIAKWADVSHPSASKVIQKYNKLNITHYVKKVSYKTFYKLNKESSFLPPFYELRELSKKSTK